MTLEPALLPLRDLQLPPPPAPWPPPAVIWLAVAALAIILTLVWWWSRRRARGAIRLALAELDTVVVLQRQAPEDPRWLAELSILLRREALGRYPREAVAGLQGEAWLDFLVSHGADEALRGEPGRWLLHGPYRRQAVVPPEHAQALLEAARHWLSMPREARGSTAC
jgi:hypothetical protein